MVTFILFRVLHLILPQLLKNVKSFEVGSVVRHIVTEAPWSKLSFLSVGEDGLCLCISGVLLVGGRAMLASLCLSSYSSC